MMNDSSFRMLVLLALSFTALSCSEKEVQVLVPTPTDPMISVENASGADLNAGTLALGATSAGRPGVETLWYIRNLGGKTLTGADGGNLAITLSGADAAQFTATPLTIASIDAGQSVVMTARLAPLAARAAGNLTATVTVTSADATSPAVAFTLTGSILAPAISAASPAAGPYFGGTQLKIEGVGFQSGATLTVGGTAATGVTVNSTGTELTCATPAGALGRAAVTLTNGNGDSDTLAAGYTYSAQLIFQRNDDFGIPNLYAADSILGAPSNFALTAYATSDNLSFQTLSRRWTVFTRTVSGDLEYFAVDHASPSAVTQITNRANTSNRFTAGITRESTPRVVFVEDMGGGVINAFSARVDGSDYSDAAGAKRVSDDPLYLLGSPQGLNFLITTEAVPRLVYVNGGLATRRICSALVDGSQYGAEIQLDDGSTGALTNYLFGAAGIASGETVPRVIARAADNGDDLWSALADGSGGAGLVRLTSGTTANPSRFRGITGEATPRVVFTRYDGSAILQMYSVPVNGSEAAVTQLSAASGNVQAPSADQFGGFIGSATPPRVVWGEDAGGFIQLFSRVSDASSAVTQLTTASTSYHTYCGILQGSPDRIFYYRDDAYLNQQVWVVNIDGTGSATQLTSGSSAAGGEGSSICGVSEGRYVITSRAIASKSGIQQIFSFDLNAMSGNEKQLTDYHATNQSVNYPTPYFLTSYFATPPGVLVVLFERQTTSGDRQYYAALSDGSAPAYRLTDSLTDNELKGGVQD